MTGLFCRQRHGPRACRPVRHVEDDSRRHAAFLAAYNERNGANAARRAELIAAGPVGEPGRSPMIATAPLRRGSRPASGIGDQTGVIASAARSPVPGRGGIRRDLGDLPVRPPPARQRHSHDIWPEPAIAGVAGDVDSSVDQASVDADRAWLVQMMADQTRSCS